MFNKNSYLFTLFLLILPFFGWSQAFEFSLTGDPVDITDWELATQSSVENDMIVLTQATGDQSGFIYYSTPQDLASCSEFTVEFEFRITNSSSPTADGIAFFYITNPPSNFLTGEGIGLPTNPEGLVMVLDTYNNDNIADNPLVSLRNLPGTVNYIEGNSTYNIAPDLTNQNFITDGNWHKCEIHYSFGDISVSFDNQAPVMVGNTTLNIVGYFGFSASTGGSWAKHAIRDVHIYGAGAPEKPDDAVFEFCQDEEVNDPLEIPGDNIEWYTTPTGGIPLPGAPTPNTSQPSSITYYVSEVVPHCNLESERAEITVTVHPKPAMPNVNIPILCSGQLSTQSPMIINSNGQWYADAAGNAPLPSPLNVNTNNAGDQIFYAGVTSNFGCKSDLLEVVIPVHQSPLLDFDFDQIYACDQSDSILIINNSTFTDEYYWFVDNFLVANEEEPTLVIEQTGNHTIMVKGENEYCESSLIIDIVTGHEFQVSYEAIPPYFCENENVVLQNTSTISGIDGSTLEASWYADGDLISNDWHLDYFLTEAKDYEITLVVNSSNGCEKSETKTITVDPILSHLFELADSTACIGESIALKRVNEDAGLSEIVIDWKDGTVWTVDSVDYRDLQHAYTTPGIYDIEVTSHFRSCPSISETFRVYIDEVPLVKFPPLDELCLHGEKIEIENEYPYNPNYNYEWSNGDKTPYTVIKEPGTYYLEVTNKQCVGKEFIHVEHDCFINFPNAFTPNGDGDNEYFIPRQLLSKGIVALEMNIFNRWGQVVFHTENINGRGWDGKFNDKEQAAGVYVYQIDVVFKNGRQESYTGNVTLIR